MSMLELIELSNSYGMNEDYVLAGGGNTSFKTKDELFIKSSGFALATIEADGFCRMDRKKLENIWNKEYSSDEKKREAEFLSDIMNSRAEGETKRPSVETLLHNLFEYSLVLHLHPAVINGVTCAKNGKQIFFELFGDEVIFIEETAPGYILAKKCKDRIEEYIEKNNEFPRIIALQNHGIFVAENTKSRIDEIFSRIYEKIGELEINRYDKISLPFKNEDLRLTLLRITKITEDKFYSHARTRSIDDFCKKSGFEKIKLPFSPDHIVYCKAYPLLTTMETLEEDIKRYKEKNGFFPRIYFVESIGMISMGKSEKEAETAKEVFIDQMKIACYTENFGEKRSMGEEFINFIINWEAESYRQKVSG